MADGLFITLEGGEATGKTTLAASLAAEISQTYGVEVVRTREPGGTDQSAKIREILLTGEADRWDPMCETALFFADRRRHVQTLIKPAIERGAWVICDRFTDSTMAYQGMAYGARSVGCGVVETFADLMLGGFAPDLTLVLDLPVPLARARLAARGEGNRVDKYPPEFHEAVRQAFLTIASAEPDRCSVLDASVPPERVLAAALAVIHSRR
ncbi:thymidylate kinase [Alphaproteobacteria bacterium]|nr:thymidylate kinase [Alphaproteobacteria bacterium]